MQVKFLKSSNDIRFFEFNNKVFPRRSNYRSIINFWFSKNENENALSIILIGEDDKIFGQNIHSSMFYHYNDEILKGEWGFDFIVSEEIRNDGYGIDILQFALKHKKTIFAVGSGPMALRIELKMGFMQIGELKKYVTISNPIYLPFTLFRGVIPKNEYPHSVKINKKSFNLVDIGQLPEYAGPFNKGLLEFGRDIAFLKWRFFNDLHQYLLYKLENGDDYFVVRTIVKRSITSLVLVDYRCNFSYNQNFLELLCAVKKVASKLRLSVIIAGSSLRNTDLLLEYKGFKSIGRPRPIITTEKFISEKQNIINREFVFATLADSDGEIIW